MPATSPRCAQPRSQRRYADPPDDPATATILVVDDDPRNLYAMERVLGELDSSSRRATAQLYFCSSSRPIWLR
jgi:hypothetical protein